MKELQVSPAHWQGNELCITPGTDTEQCAMILFQDCFPTWEGEN